MAKGETFFIRAQVETDTSNEERQEAVIDLGAYVNLGLKQSTLLRVHSVQQQICDKQGLVPTIDGAASAGVHRYAFCNSAITTKRYIDTADPKSMPQLFDDSTMYSAAVIGENANTDTDNGIYSHDTDIAPQHLSTGYLVGVDNLYLYAAADNAFAEDVFVNVLLECSLESATQSNAVALALSQQ
tara:strand:+ start:596 stop:1150 length:555 start_codon:yes stop_codon:yes gene_type:complete